MNVAKSRSKRALARRGANSSPDRARQGSFSKTAASLAEIGRGFYARGWVLGTSGNFSAVILREPLRLAITSTGLDKGGLTAAQFLEIDDRANVVRESLAEAKRHVEILEFLMEVLVRSGAAQGA